MVSDKALVEIVRMAIRALDAMVNARGNPVPDVGTSR
jgi:hypothetical protein